MLTPLLERWVAHHALELYRVRHWVVQTQALRPLGLRVEYHGHIRPALPVDLVQPMRPLVERNDHQGPCLLTLTLGFAPAMQLVARHICDHRHNHLALPLGVESFVHILQPDYCSRQNQSAADCPQ
jgi:hypothetical protein